MSLSSSPQDAAEEEEAHRSVLPSALSVQPRGNNAFDTSSNKQIPHHNEVSSMHAASGGPPSVRGKSTSKATLAVFIFIAAALALTSLCIKMRTKTVGAGLSQRRLAGSEEAEGNEDEELNNILEQCLSMELEYQMTSGGLDEPTHATQPLLQTLHPTSSIPGEKSQSMTGPMHAASQADPSTPLEPTDEGPKHSTPSSARPASSPPLFPSLAPGAWLEDIPSIYGAEVGYPQGAATTAIEGTVGMEGPTYKTPQIVDSHFLSPAEGSQVVAPSVPSFEGSLSTAPVDALSPFAWLMNIPPLLAGEVKPNEMHEMDEGKQEEEQQPSTSAAASAEFVEENYQSPEPTDMRVHPFIRLPTAPRGLPLRQMNPDDPPPRAYQRVTSTELLAVLRELFAKSKLTPEDVEVLLDATEALVRFTRSHIRPISTSRMAHVLRHVGIIFMSADAIASTAEILGLNLPSNWWWSSFIESFPQKDIVKEPRKDVKEAAHVNYALLKRLFAALDIYKTGVRPPVKEVLSLKRKLLCSQTTLTYFRTSRWNPWRIDDEEFEARELETTDDSEEEDEDE